MQPVPTQDKAKTLKEIESDLQSTSWRDQQYIRSDDDDDETSPVEEDDEEKQLEESLALRGDRSE